MTQWQHVRGVLVMALLGLANAATGQSDSDTPTDPATIESASGVLVDSGGGLIDATGDFGSPSLNYQDSEEPTLVLPDATSYQFYITDLESRYGPYAQGLSEQLLGLGNVYERQGLHEEAATVYKRGVHIARVNDGLYSSAQIPLLQGLIRSLTAMGEYETADERQFYLYRVQSRVYGQQSEQMSLAMLERADWEREAYYLSLGDASFIRLLTMWELYSNVLKNVARTEGNLSAALLRPLQGLLQTQYMISTYTPQDQMGLHAGASPDENFAQENRFSMIRVSNYKQGQAVITAMREVYGYNEEEQSPRPAEALVRLGDWHLWHQKRESAIDAYRRAWEELGALENGDAERQRYFGRPVLLPDLPGARTELTPPAVVTAFVDVSYNISPRGRVRSLEVLNEEFVKQEDEQTDGNRVKLMRSIKRLLYRPRFEAGEPVLVEDVRERYAY